MGRFIREHKRLLQEYNDIQPSINTTGNKGGATIMKREHCKNGKILPPFSENLVFYAPLLQGDLSDHISGIHGAPISGGSVTWTSSENAYLFTTGRTAALNFPNIDVLMLIPDSYTIVCDLKVAQSTTTFYIFAPGTYGNNCFPIVGTHNCGIASDTANWHRIVSVCDKEQLQQIIYVDSNHHITLSRNVDFGIWSDNYSDAELTNISLGVFYANYYGYSYMRDFRIYNRAFTASEVAQL